MGKSQNRSKTVVILIIIIISILSVVSGAILVILASSLDNLSTILKEELLKDIGIALIIIGLASLFYEYFLRMNTIDIVKESLNELFEKKCEFKSIISLGLKNLYRTSADYNIIDKATKEIKLLGIPINSYFGLEGSHEYTKLKKLVENNCKLKILMLNPNSLHVYYRGKVENNPDLKGDIEDSFEKKKRFIGQLTDGVKQNVEIKFYDTYPLYAMTIIDDCFIRVTPFLYNKVGQQCPTSEYERKAGGIFDAYVEHFNDLWNEKRFLFDWNEISRNDSDRFKDFLIKNYGISCTGDTEINKTNEGKVTVSIVSTKRDILSFKLNDDRTKATLSIYCGRTDEFLVEKEKGKLNIYEGTINALATNQ